MKKPVKRALIIVASILIIIVATGVFIFSKFKSETSKMHPCPTQELVKGVFSINDSYVNMYLVKDSDNYIAVDAGSSVSAIEKGLKNLKIDRNKVTAVLLTHTDNDHVAAISLFKNAIVYFSKEEEQMINRKTVRAAGMHNKIDTKQYTVLDDGQTLTIGRFIIKGILVPGHTPGLMCYLIDHRWLFTGDAFGISDGEIIPFNNYFNMNTPQAINSISKLTSLTGVEAVFTAHYGYSGEFTRMADEWNKSADK